jgi:dTDP-glucose pyrophosphorylase
MGNASMKAVILAAGKGTRMKHLTSDVPKPMLPVAGRPVLDHIIQALAATGIEDICVITGYRADVVEKYFGCGTSWGVKISYVRQTIQDGTGKAPELARDFVGDSSFLLLYGDILVDPSNYPRMIQTFHEAGTAGLITVRRGEDVSKGAAVSFDDQFMMTDLVEKPPPGTACSPWYNAGIYAFRPVLFRYTASLQKSPRNEYELPDALRVMTADGYRIKGLELTGYWVDVRDPEMLTTADSLLMQKSKKKIQELHAKVVGVGNPSEERANS